jgi:hypothetical protein
LGYQLGNRGHSDQSQNRIGVGPHEQVRIGHDLVMIGQAAVLALAGSIYPLAALIVIGLLTRPDGLRLALICLAGAALAVTLTALAVLWLLATLDLNTDQSRAASGWLYVALGLTLVVIAAVLIRRRGTPHTPPPPRQPGPLAAFLLGIAMYFPGPMYVAAIKTVSDANAGAAMTAVGVAVCVVCVLALAEGPIVFRCVARQRSERALAAYGSFVAEHGRDVLLAAALVVGGYLISRGLYIVWTA